MTKYVKKHFLLSTVLFSLLFISCFYSIMVPSAYAAEETLQETGLVISNDVVGLDLTKYVTTTKEFPQDSYLDVLPQERIRYNLQSYESKLDMLYTFINGNLQKIHVLEVDGSPEMTTATANPLEMAKDFLGNYRSHTGDSFYGELRSTLDTVDLNKNLTSISGNKKLEVTTSRDSTTFRWTYTFNGIEAPDKCVALHYENGFLKYFIDNWGLYKIGSTTVYFSEQQTIDIAIAQANTFSWNATVDNETLEGLKYNVTNAMVWKTVFVNSLFMNNPRGQDPLMLFPTRHVWVSFDKFYPGNVYGMNVYVWADTGEIGHAQERYITHDPPAGLMVSIDDVKDAQASDISTESNSMSSMWIILPAIVTLMMGTVAAYFGRKKTLHWSLHLPKLRSVRILGLLLCLMLVSTILIAASASTVNALPQHGGATIWGSESKGAWNDTLGFSWRKHPDEVDQQDSTAAYINSLFQQNGYSSTDKQGNPGSIKYAILDQIQTLEQNYPRVAVVDFDHGNGLNETEIMGAPDDEWHYMFEDNIGTKIGPMHPGSWARGNGVYDMEIYPNTALGRYFFVLINTCNSAHVEPTLGNPPNQQVTTQGLVGGRARGMPYAWTHRLVKPKNVPGFTTDLHMSYYGYADPDNGDFVYLGFHYGSAALNQTVEGESGPKPYWWWLWHFFAHALTDNLSVKQALDEASQDMWNSDFGQTDLHTGYQSIWPQYRSDNPPIDPPYWHYDSGCGEMRVYGNAHIKLYQPALTLSATGGLSPTFYIDDHQYYTGTHRLITDVYTINVSDIPGYEFTYFSYQGHYYGRPATIQIASDGELTAHYNLIQGDYEVSVYAWGLINDYPVYQLAPPFYIDRELVGSAWNTYQVSEGYHTFAVDPVLPIAPPFAYWVFRCWKHYDHGHIYTIYQPEFGFDVDEDTTLVAAYDLWGVPPGPG